MIGMTSISFYGQSALNEITTEEFENHKLLQSPLFLSWLGLISVITGVGMVSKAVQIKVMLKH